MRSRDLIAGLIILLVLALAACGDPDVALEVPTRAPDQHVLDEVGVLDAAVEEALREVSERSGLDVVAVAFEDEQASRGQADRGGNLVLDAWDADVALVVVGAPGDLTSTEEDRRRHFGVTAGDRFVVTRDLRERIVTERVPGPAADNEWPRAFQDAIDELAAELPTAADGG